MNGHAHPQQKFALLEIFLAVSSIQPVPGKTICLEEYEGNSDRTPLPFEIDGGYSAIAYEYCAITRTPFTLLSGD